MPAPDKSTYNRPVALISGILYRASLIGIRLSGVPILGKPITKVFGGRHLKIITMPVNLKLQSEAAILPLFHLTSKGPLTINRKALPLPRAGRFHLRAALP